MSCSYSLATFALVLVLRVGKIEGTCTASEVITLNKCALANLRTFAIAWSGGVCNLTIIENQLCDDFETFVDCFNNADVSSSTCRPYAIQLLNLQFEAYYCKVNDFVSQCSCVPEMNQGSGANSLMHGHELMGMLLSPVVPVLAAWLARV
ncbi:uncharacterized protein LOC112569619 [Pomacea canaliculata]|uniref:uncharacterized protein LOC112569619 n=1 Tax=Pomacea canaliculata TaxID=400727 RepID=UPI000D73EF91|nr:uncharacterized protein LOC112569619 [Pomacea canaliculata]